MIETNLAQTVNVANDSGSAYDTNARYIPIGAFIESPRAERYARWYKKSAGEIIACLLLA